MAERPMSTLTRFLEDLFRDGRAVLRAPPSEEPSYDADEVLSAAFRTARLDVAGPLVELDVEVARKAASHLHAACWALLHPGDDPKLPALAAPVTAAHHLSADLILRYLPKVHERAAARAHGTPLAEALEETLRRFPLSGVLSSVDEPPLSLELGHEGLELLYAERLVANDRLRWRPPTGTLRERWELVLVELGKPLPATPLEPA